MNALFECDQCTHREWRPEEQEPWLCVVCGNMRWGVVATDAPDEDGFGGEYARGDTTEPDDAG